MVLKLWYCLCGHFNCYNCHEESQFFPTLWFKPKDDYSWSFLTERKRVREREREREREQIALKKRGRKKQFRWVIDTMPNSSQWEMVEGIWQPKTLLEGKHAHTALARRHWHTPPHEYAHAHTPKHKSSSITIQCCFAEILYHMIGEICCKHKKGVAAVVHAWFCVGVCVFVCVKQQSCVSLWMCKCHPTISPPSLSLTSVAISEAAVEAALFWQMLTLSKCISEDVMVLVTLPLPPSLSLFPPFSSLLSLFLVCLGPCTASNKVYFHGTTTDDTVHNVLNACTHGFSNALSSDFI